MFKKSYKTLKDSVWLSSGFLGQTFELDVKDFEGEFCQKSMFRFLKSLNSTDFVSFHLFSDISHNCRTGNKRDQEIQKIGFVKKKLFFHVFTKKEIPFFLSKHYEKSSIERIENFRSRFLNLKPVLIKKFFQSFFDFKRVKVEPFGLSNEKEFLAVLKMKALASSFVEVQNLILLQESLPLPFEYHIKLKKMQAIKQQASLSRLQKQESLGATQESFLKHQAVQEALCDMELEGSDFFQFEIHLLLRRSVLKTLREDISVSKKQLSSLGEFEEEKFGAFQGLLSTLPAEGFHTPMVIKDEELSAFLPIFTRGCKMPLDSKTGLLFHRMDQSLDVLNPFHSHYDNYCGVIIGKSGRGKSVFTNLLLESLSSDKSLKILLVDVKGSYTKRVQSLNGRAFPISLSEPSGLDPFCQLTRQPENLEVVLSFLKTLTGGSLSALENAFLEKNLIQYAKQAQNPSLQGFVKSLKNFQKKTLLENWTKGSLKENIFSRPKDSFIFTNLNYFNFSEILTAEDQSTAQAVMSAVMCRFSHELLNKKPHEKLLFLVDETPFFIQNSFETFKLLSKNVRKLNASLILIAQSSSDLIFNSDKSLIDNSEFKVIFSLDDNEKAFQERFFLRQDEVDILKYLRTQKGDHSEFLLKDSLCSKVGFLRLSDKEYIESTTNPQEVEKLHQIQRLYPLIESEKLSQAFRFLESL